MGKFLETKYSDLQNRVIRKPGKPIRRSTTNHDEHKHKKVKRKSYYSKDQEPPLKKSRTTVESDKSEPENAQVSEFQDLAVEVKTNVSSGNEYLKLIKQDEDLFADDDLKGRYDQFTQFNLIFLIFDEIALEGLDGITIEAFWKRLNNALKLSTCLDHIRDYIWHIICSNHKIMFYELPEPRQNLIILNRDAYVTKENVFMEVYQTGPDIYKVEFAPKGDIWGSCATLQTRIDISDQVRSMSLDEALSTYKNKLVMVADQQLRFNALLDELTDPNYEFTQTEYCLLERIGRSRELGEITQGPAALSNYFGMDSKSVYHYCKRFNKEYLVTRQFFCVRSTMDQNKIGRLLQLRRFYTKKKSKYQLLTEGIVNYLKKCPGYKAPYSAVKSIFQGPINPKFFKNHEFQRYINTNICIPYKELHPEAQYKEYMTKSLVKERVINVIELKDPFVNIAACWTDSPHPDSSEDEEDNEDDVNVLGKGKIFNMEFVREVYLAIYAKGGEGCTTQEVNTLFDVDFPTIRSVLKKLVYRNLIVNKKCDVGRQKIFRYIATCFTECSNIPITQPVPAVSGSSSVIERLKERQRQKISNLEKNRVYTREQFEADQQLRLLGLEKPSYLSVTFTIPQIICEYFIAKLTDSNIQEDKILVEFKEIFKPFKIKLTIPKLNNSRIVLLRQILLSGEAENIENFPNLRENFGNFYSGDFKSDYLTKAVLLQALFSEKINTKRVIEFLDPSWKKLKQPEKRDRTVQHIKIEESQCSTSQGGVTSSERKDLASYMGPYPVNVLTEIDEADDIVLELFVSTLPKNYKMGDLKNYVSPPDVPTTDRVMSRIKVILEVVNAQKVFEEAHKLLKIIWHKEAQEGYDKKMDRKSLHRIINRLVNEGYIKVYQFIVSNKTVKKIQSYVCHPAVDHSHEIIRNGMDQIKFKFSCGSRKVTEVIEPVRKKTKQVETSPFGEHDVLQSIQEINQLHPPKHITMKAISSKKAGKLYGFRPKFARMSLLHEILFYLVYLLGKDVRPLRKDEILELFRKYQIHLTESDLEKLPPVYCKEISWRMFIPPLPCHQGWSEGWALICDIILRIPLSLIVRLYCINFVSTELQEILQHPIKRFYLLKNLTPQIQYLVMYRRKCIHDIHFILVRLAYCGLVQFGPSRYKEKDQGFIYLNRKASLLETMTSDPGYHKITDKEYKRVTFEFDRLETVINYWVTMHNICMSTLLNARHVVEGQTITLIDVSAKPSLNKTLKVRKQDEVKKYDIGEIPGDRRGAAGLDSAMWSHIQKNWFYFAQKSPQNFRDELASLRMDKVISNEVSFDHLKLPPVANKFYISKPSETKPLPSRKIADKRTTKKLPIVRRIIPFARRRKPAKKTQKDYDDVDRAILRKYSVVRFRPSWNEEEDKVLILLKIASAFVTPGTNKQVINYTSIRDILHKVLPESRNKISRTLPRRLKILQRDVPFLSNIETLIPSLFKLPIVAKYFVPLRKCIANERDAFGRKFKLSEVELNNAFIFLAHYMLTHRKEVETALHGNLTTIDYFNEENLHYTVTRLVPFEQETKNYVDPVNVEEIRKYALKNIFQSALGHRIDHPAWCYQMYKIYQKFDQSILKKTIEELRDQHMIQSKKEPLKKFFTPFKFSLNYVFSQTTTFTYHTPEGSFKTFLDLKYEPQKLQFILDNIEANKYGQLFGMNEILTFMMPQINLNFWFPEHHFMLNPAIEDHSQVIDELAKRYYNKLKNERKAAELQTRTQPDPYPEITEPEPGPSATDIAPPEDIENLQFDDDEPLDLTITSTNSTTITNLKHWISDCIDTERVRSPSPELLNLDVGHQPVEREKKKDLKKLDDMVEAKEGEDRMLTLEEIKEEIVKPTPANEKRRVPYITDLVKLLSENFEESDEQTIDEMKKHFVQQYPYLEKLDVDGFNDNYLVKYLESRPILKDMWEKVEKEAYVIEASDNGQVFDKILEKGGTIEDVSLASELINFIFEKGVFGATSSELKENFCHSGGSCTLEFILKILMDHKDVIRTGVCTITFVHNKFQSAWHTDTFFLTDEHVKVFKKDSTKVEVDIDERIESANWLKIKAVPWIKVDGSLDKSLFKVWLSSIFSYCVEHPKALFTSVCDKFCFLRPLDIFYLVEILQEIGCLEMRKIQPSEFDPFSEYKLTEDCPATFLDKFEEIYLEINQISFMSLGSFLHNN